MASISTRISGAARALTSTRVEAGKSPVKNSRRASQTLVLLAMRVRKTVIFTTSDMAPPAASTSDLILPKMTLAWAYSSILPSASGSALRAVMPET